MDPITVELRLALDAFKGDVEKAVSYVKSKLGNTNVAGVSGGKQASDADKIAATAQRATQGAYGATSGAFGAMNPELAASMSSLGKEAGKAERAAKIAAARNIRDRANFMKDMSFLMMPLMQPGSVWSTMFSTRQAFTAFTATEKGRGIAGGSVGMAAVITAGLVAAATALGASFDILKKAIQGTIQSYREASKQYSKALQTGGLPLGFTVRRAALASVMGVGEKEVFQFGRQVMYLSDKLAWANQTIAKSTTELTSVDWEFKIMGQNMRGLFSIMAQEAAPAMKLFAEGMNAIIVSSATFWQTNKEKVTNFVVGMIGGPVAGLLHKLFGGTFADALKRLSGIDKMPSPHAYMKRLDVASWERMGLVVGNVRATNPAVETAKNTRQTVQELKALRTSATPRSGMAFFDPAVSNP